MKLLIGAACIAIIAFVGYYFWNGQKVERQQFAANCHSIAQNGPPDETPSDKRLASKRIQDCVDFLKTGKLPTRH
ncbi:hypothetical protein [Ochrobactrum sp. Marseille-Q0166]|uniref:hypothetical protein n=1 Tax=Ochrobactrum sp. Marseille-Q0166 TaxID=2761105 RepID=UPI0016564371|nr:hypothetical protein [Ochrobactrum sp. Marseille-Q0166]MBC8719312.1 hypothetical protein [Ochrobactrum sp. Marseille-Q0166]